MAMEDGGTRIGVGFLLLFFAMKFHAMMLL